MISHRKIHILFVGAFPRRPAQHIAGGQIFASQSLIQSALSDYVKWHLIDSTMTAVPPPPVYRRFGVALKRVTHIFMVMVFYPVDGLLIFTSSGLSFIEKGLIAIVGSLLSIPVVLCPRDGFMPRMLERSAFLRSYVRFVLRHCSYVVCQSAYWKEFYQKVTNLPDWALPVVKNWMNVAPYVKIPFPQNSAVLTVLFMGWIEKFKGIYDLLEVAHQFRRLLPDTQFIICGAGSDLENVKERAHIFGLDRLFEFRGWVQGQEKLQAYREADILVHPSYAEGTPNAVLEAMAAGRAVIATRVGGIPDIIHPERNGILINAGDIFALGNALVRLRNSYAFRRELGEQAREYILKEHDVEQIWPILLSFFQPSDGNTSSTCAE